MVGNAVGMAVGELIRWIVHVLLSSWFGEAILLGDWCSGAS